jgi:serine O-acetyltransferase
LPHHYGIIISSHAKIGKNCTIFQQVTIGDSHSRNSPNEASTIIIGNDVLIGAGAKILGNVVIGDNVRIGANAVVISNIPSNCTAVGVPAHIIKM